MSVEIYLLLLIQIVSALETIQIKVLQIHIQQQIDNHQPFQRDLSPSQPYFERLPRLGSNILLRVYFQVNVTYLY